MAVRGSGLEGEEADDWVLDSLERYERLHVFELQDPTLCMEWSHDYTSVFVGGFSHDKHNEVLQLFLPEKLLPPHKQTLLARRDFKIGCGGISKWPIHHIKCVANTQENRVLVSSGLQPELTVWGRDPGSPDLMVATGNVTTPTPTLTDPNSTELFISWVPSQPDTIVCGSSMKTLQLTDLNTLQPVWSPQRGSLPEDSTIHSLKRINEDPDTILTCSDTGELRLLDSRTPSGEPLKKGLLEGATSGGTPAGPQGAISGGTSAGPQGAISGGTSAGPQGATSGGTSDGPQGTISGGTSAGPQGATTGGTLAGEMRGCHSMAVSVNWIATLSDVGEMKIYDRRGESWLPLVSCQLPVIRLTSSFSQFSSTRRERVRPCIQFSQSSNQVSVSGPGRGVAVYDIISLSNDITNPIPVFLHDGHEVDNTHSKVTVHTWHPSFNSMILSCDTEGAMHAWQWCENQDL